MTRYNSAAKYNQLGTVKYNTLRLARASALYNRLPGARPVVLDQTGKRLAVLDNAHDIILDQEINGADTLTFSLPLNDPKKQYLVNENRVLLVDAEYIIRRIEEMRDESNRKVKVFCEASWYDLMVADPLPVANWTDVTPDVPMRDILSGTGWSLGTVEITTRRTLTVDQETTNRLNALRQVTEVWGGELEFDTAARRVHLRQEIARRPGIVIAFRKNMRSIEKITDTTDLITRLYPYGKNGLTIADANNGVPYVENFQYTTAVRVGLFKDERFTNPFHLKERAEEILEQVSKPRVSYVVKAIDLSALSGFEHESFRLGDYVIVHDEELGVQIETRIMRWAYNVAEPWQTELELSSRTPTLTNLLETVSETNAVLQSADAVDRQDMLELMVFNYLLNSRADDGFAYWVNNGWTIDNTQGYSGPASFKCVGQFGVAKTLSQTVWPSHRDAYTLSFRVQTQNVVKGSNGRVGVEVIIRYEDGSSETKFLSLI